MGSVSGVSGAGSFPDDPTEMFINYAMKWDPDGVDYYMNDVFMHRFTTDQLVMYLSGQLRPVVIPEMPMFMKLSAHLQQLSRHIGDIVPLPAHTSQSGARSVERALGASHGTIGLACKAAE